MGVTTFTEEHASPVAPVRLFKALITEAHESLPKLAPQSVKAIEVEGGGGAGSIRKTAFHAGSHLKYVKHRIDSVDTQNLSCKYTLIEGDILDDKLESISYFVKFEPSGNGGCLIKTTYEYHTKGDIKLNEEDIKAGQETTRVLSKTVEDYLLKNPSAYA